MTGTCWDDGPDYCSGCSYCYSARHTPPDEPVYYPDEQAAHDADMAIARAFAAVDTTERKAS